VIRVSFRHHIRDEFTIKVPIGITSGIDSEKYAANFLKPPEIAINM